LETEIQRVFSNQKRILGRREQQKKENRKEKNNHAFEYIFLFREVNSQ
jgi:hypothetical protein